MPAWGIGKSLLHPALHRRLQAPCSPSWRRIRPRWRRDRERRRQTGSDAGRWFAYPLEYHGGAARGVNVEAYAQIFMELRMVDGRVVDAILAAELVAVGVEHHLIIAFADGMGGQEEVRLRIGGMEVEQVQQAALGEGDNLAVLIDP